MSRPLVKGEPHINLHYTCGKGDSREQPLFSDLYDFSVPGPFNSLLLHRVPSASLYPEEMLAQWSPRPPQPPFIHAHTDDDNICTRRGTERSSISSLIEYGDRLSEQSCHRPPSLLPPAPQLNRTPSDTIKVECRLSSPEPPLGCHERNTDSTPRTQRELLHQLTAQLGGISLEQETLLTPPTSPVTPVPSLTNSHRSDSSFAISESSPCPAVGSSKDYFESLLADNSHDVMVPHKRTGEANTGSGIRSITPPLPNSLLYQNTQLGRVPQATNLLSGSKFVPPQPLPNPDFGVTAIHLPQGSQEHHEISYIDWDDDDSSRHHNSPLTRIKKSFTDLRAAERFISEANIRKKGNLTPRKESRGSISKVQDREVCKASRVSRQHQQRPYSPRSTLSLKEESSLTRLSSRLRKKPSIKLLSHSLSKTTPRTETSERKTTQMVESIKPDGLLSAPPRNTTTPPASPSMGNKKRANKMTSERWKEAQKKKVKFAVLGRQVMRLLGSKQVH
ncbi:uncharacterized protein Z519_03558 [Cladophialophora bantiana CBS 173.52]|uniref:Uncharacterized protein n=1 Tax=Cladophialophora bantiana (strain ATCC 10958 / CBS 173.52 / CDC B-1940 / NIH 8579) TaxID=1442370 RepID=A0A0D2IIB9_CLAB1|nr:uncharacterized protein Z519_03558 [Cladophialophora bantiana CBS 173.52]KIW96489.1 hypothetical protein Z519_03558 [Cladophialophora bantiana CBS 173.52]